MSLDGGSASVPGMSASPSDRGVTLELAASGTAPAQARRFVIAQLRQWDLAHCEDAAALLVSELVTNALLHARTDMVVGLNRINGRVVLEVTDGSSQAPTARRFSLHAGTGRGLHLIESMSQDWGVRTLPSGKTVWAELSVDPDEPQEFAFDIDAVEAL